MKGIMKGMGRRGGGGLEYKPSSCILQCKENGMVNV